MKLVIKIAAGMIFGVVALVIAIGAMAGHAVDHATKKLGIPSERVVMNVDRYGNTSSGSIPLALAEAQAEGRLQAGSLVLMTGMGAGLTWGSALMRWTLEASA